MRRFNTVCFVVSALVLIACVPSANAAQVQIAKTITTGLNTPWGLTFLPDGSALVSERNSGLIKRVTPAGKVSIVGRVKGVSALGEGGLLGIAAIPASNPTAIYAYETTKNDNRVVRIAWNGSSLGKQTAILTGIAKADHHDGGRILPGPNNTLFVATGDAGIPSSAQRLKSLNGKILRIDLQGKPAAGNPFKNSRVYSLGHRNVQGLALDAKGQLWASEFGEKKADELNLIQAGKNYGWPKVEGSSSNKKFVNPFTQWKPTSLASPSGIAIVDDTAYVASLRGEVLWQVPLSGSSAGKATAVQIGDLGRLRTVGAAPDGSMWLITGNTDGRGNVRPGDDRILRLTVNP
ncbi:MAG: PQQ-dependent sugar dehydrogenase [Actinomycetota bacterium]|nr:PQQ-dependent sugar dehydrogenase [Actinomycetota bacterium]